MALYFDGATNVYYVGQGAVSNGAKTFAAIVKLGSSADGTTGVVFHASTNSTLSHRWWLSKTSADILYYQEGDNHTQTSSLQWKESDGWCLVGVAKSSGAAPRFFKFPYASSISFENGSTVADGGNQLSVSHTFGKRPAGEYLDFTLLAAAYWNIKLSDAQISALPYSFANWWSVAPKAMWIFDQSATAQAVPDLTGNGADGDSTSGSIVTQTPPLTYGHEIIRVTGLIETSVVKTVAMPAEARGYVTKAQALPLEWRYYPGGTIVKSVAGPLEVIGVVKRAGPLPLDGLQETGEPQVYVEQERLVRRKGLPESLPPRADRYWLRLDSGRRRPQ